MCVSKCQCLHLLLLPPHKPSPLSNVVDAVQRWQRFGQWQRDHQLFLISINIWWEVQWFIFFLHFAAVMMAQVSFGRCLWSGQGACNFHAVAKRLMVCSTNKKFIVPSVFNGFWCSYHQNKRNDEYFEKIYKWKIITCIHDHDRRQYGYKRSKKSFLTICDHFIIIISTFLCEF